MINIYTVDKKNKLKTCPDNIYICQPCYNYINSEELKKLLSIIDTKHITQNKQIKYNRCNICNRLILNIINGIDIIKFLELKLAESNNILTDEILLQITKYSNWFYHDIYDYFNYTLAKKFNLSKEQCLSINYVMNSMEGLPSISVINNKSENLLFYIKNHCCNK